MKNLKKYFDFSGTISGTTYFFRNLLSSIIGFIGGVVIGTGFATDNNLGIMTLGFLITTPAIAFQLSTVWKRLVALFPNNVKEFFATFLIVSVVSQFAQSGEYAPLFSLLMIIIGCILIFKNSKIENHNG
jgi:uncharacterized membrane protein YhaH (DUF805 family)